MIDSRQRFTGKVAVVTGGTSGIGLATARRLLSEGAAVFVAARNVARGREIEAATDSERLSFVAADVTKRDALDALFAAVASRYGRLDVLVCSAGRTVVGPLSTLKSEHWRASLRVNLLMDGGVTAGTGHPDLLELFDLSR